MPLNQVWPNWTWTGDIWGVPWRLALVCWQKTLCVMWLAPWGLCGGGSVGACSRVVPKYLIRIRVCRVEAGSVLWTPCCILAVSDQSLAHCPAGGGVCFPCAWSVPMFSWMCKTHMITSRTVLEQNDQCYSLHLSWILMLLLIDDSGASSEGQQKGVSRAGYEKQHWE